MYELALQILQGNLRESTLVAINSIIKNKVVTLR